MALTVDVGKAGCSAIANSRSGLRLHFSGLGATEGFHFTRNTCQPTWAWCPAASAGGIRGEVGPHFAEGIALEPGHVHFSILAELTACSLTFNCRFIFDHSDRESTLGGDADLYFVHQTPQ